MTDFGICPFMEIFVGDKKFHYTEGQIIPDSSKWCYGMFCQFPEYHGK